ncbi:hypothetical protein DL96DRAFT_1630141 [Flagelloscypha sp. PMI_526]|nr:hypothetical protein DL96DRAFT_1630141 [Flagelloscypha sp. PMI_526]
MLHFPSSGGQVAKRSDSLNATQHLKTSSDLSPFFLKVEEELHDARRVKSHGQEDDLRMALAMVIDRVSDMSNRLAEAYRLQADLEVQLNVTKSNLKLVIANNEMLEEALKQDSHSRGAVGWRRGNQSNHHDTRPYSADFAMVSDPNVSSPGPGLVFSPASPSAAPSPPAPQDSRFFKFRFSRPTTPTTAPGSLNGGANGHSPMYSPTHSMVEDLQASLEKERAARQKIAKEKAELEEELESLSQALFEEANKMVAQERIKHAETTDELEAARMEKAALKSALQVVEGENRSLREGSQAGSPSSEFSSVPYRARTMSEISLADVQHDSRAESSARDPSLRTVSHSRSSSQNGTKSVPSSRSSSRSRKHVPEALILSEPSPPVASVEQFVSPPTRPDEDSRGPDTAKPPLHSEKAIPPTQPAEDPDKTISMPSSSDSVDSGIDNYHTPNLPDAPTLSPPPPPPPEKHVIRPSQPMTVTF